MKRRDFSWSCLMMRGGSCAAAGVLSLQSESDGVLPRVARCFLLLRFHAHMLHKLVHMLLVHDKNGSVMCLILVLHVSILIREGSADRLGHLRWSAPCFERWGCATKHIENAVGILQTSYYDRNGDRHPRHGRLRRSSR